MSDTLILNPKDDVAVCLRELTGGQTLSVLVDGKESVLKISDDIPKGHKLAIRPIRAGQHVHKFGYSIGLAAGSAQMLPWGINHLVKSGLCSLSAAWNMASFAPDSSSVSPINRDSPLGRMRMS
ncbi:MAG: Altronate dehydratase [Cohnella sp.]|jgi:altronate hydrolase|nr:Altronate dehydratase [Cohnella sp.]